MTKKTTKAPRRNSKKAPINPATPNNFESGVQAHRSNGLDGVIYGMQREVGSVQVSQTDTLQKNLRYYLVSNFRQLLSQLYVEMGFVQTIVDIPVDDALRGGVTIQSEQVTPEELKELEREMDEEGDLETYGQGLKWARLFGGGGVLIITGQDPETPLDMEALEGEEVYLRAIDMWELYYTRQNTEDYSAAIDEGLKEFQDDLDYFDYYGKKIHKSRVIVFKGIEAPSFVRPRLRGWGISIVEVMVRSINQYLKATDLSFELLDEFKLDIFKIKNLAATLMRPDGESIIMQRTALANYQKNYQNALTMDMEDDYVQKQLSFSGLGEVQQGIRTQLASDLRMPITKLFGVSSAGFNSGEDDIENYNTTVESYRSKAKRGLVKLIKLRCAQKFGFVPTDLEIEFSPLRILPADQEENIKDKKYNRLMQARERGEITSKEFAEACNKENLLPIKIKGAPERAQKLVEEASVNPTASKKSTTAAKPAPQAKG